MLNPRANEACFRRRYNVVTFLPRFLFEQFSQVAYFYFLVQVRALQLRSRNSAQWGSLKPTSRTALLPHKALLDVGQAAPSGCMLLRHVVSTALAAHVLERSTLLSFPVGTGLGSFI